MIKSLNVVIPMSGAGKRFKEAGYAMPKPFIDVGGKPMIERVIENLLTINHVRMNFILMAREEHTLAHPAIIKHLRNSYSCEVIPVDGLTEGAACTVLQANRLINNSSELLIANADQLINCDFTGLTTPNASSSILIFRDETKNKKWSYVEFVKNSSFVRRVAEKDPISEYATAGLYYFREGRMFVNNAVDMISRNDRVNGEFYVCPSFNYAAGNMQSITTFEMPKEAMIGLGTPEDLEKYLTQTK